MTARVSRGLVGEFETVVLENRLLRAVIVPALGGRVWVLEDLLRGRQWIWHRPGVALKAWPAGTSYDDVWAGGWEELFPNDAPCSFEGRQLPDHGEWWTLRWSITSESADRGASVTLRAESSILRARCIKEFHLEDDGARLSVTYRIRSDEERAAHFLFKQHLPIAITPGCRLALPGGRVEPVDPCFSTLLPSGAGFDWPSSPDSGRQVDMQVIPPPSSGLQEFVYVSGLPEAWCRVDDADCGASIRLEFDSGVFPYVWLFLTYGGWKGLYTAVLEPCSNMPKDLTEAVRTGRSAMLLPGQELVTTVSVTLEGLAETFP